MDNKINANMLIPDIVSKYPRTRLVFDKYGLRGCGGSLGPKETIEYFSKVHGVDLKTLLDELNTVPNEIGEISEPIYKESVADTIYKRFFKLGIIIVLTVGCLLGAINLAIYAILHSFTVVNLLPLIHAHANSMVFGFLGIFVMGFVCQGLPRFKQLSLYRPELAVLSFKLIIFGIVLRFVSIILAYDLSLVLGFISTLFQLFSVFIFLFVMIKTLAQSNKKEDFNKYIYTGLFYFLLIAVFEPTIFYFTKTASDQKALLYIISTFYGPLRDIQFLGFALMMILGVSQRLFPSALSMSELKRTTSNAVFIGLNFALVLDVVSYLLVRAKYYVVGGIGLQISYLLFFIFVLIFIYNLKVFKNTGINDRSLKFIRASFVWLMVSCIMLVLFPLYNYLTEQHFSHAFSGATRHAFTVGFISMMIIGVSSKIAPMLAGKDAEKLSSLGFVFVLFNLGNVIRVVMQILTDFTHYAYPIMGVSGFIEVIALSVWGYDMFKNMRIDVVSDETISGIPKEITADMKVATVLKLFPATMDIFLEHGFTDLKNPILRNTVAKAATIKMACGIHSVNVDKFIGLLNNKIKKSDLSHRHKI